MKLIKSGRWIVLLFLVGCANVPISHTPYHPSDTAKNLIVFLDGTANDEGSHTNISKLHNLIRLQDRSDIYTTYIKGVGVDGKILGMATGWGIGQDVRQAYQFLAENFSHQAGDKVYSFGFSRGSFAARILASMLYVAGLPKLDALPSGGDGKSKVEAIYAAFKGEKTLEERKEAVSNILGFQPRRVTVTFMGVWDTVEALGWPDYSENFRVPNPRYGDQLCNIEKAAHAVSLDDDRARIFTPILLTRRHLISDCADVNIDSRVEEVWFSGAHADVGGGYGDTELSGVSLNWMLGRIASYGLAPKSSRVYADFADRSHDPENGFPWSLLYHKRYRDLALYTDGAVYGKGKLLIHPSVVDRLQQCGVADHESKWLESEKYRVCLSNSGNPKTFNVNAVGCKAIISIAQDENYRKFGSPRCGNDLPKKL